MESCKKYVKLVSLLSLAQVLVACLSNKQPEQMPTPLLEQSNKAETAGLSVKKDLLFQSYSKETVQISPERSWSEDSSSLQPTEWTEQGDQTKPNTPAGDVEQGGSRIFQNNSVVEVSAAEGLKSDKSGKVPESKVTSPKKISRRSSPSLVPSGANVSGTKSSEMSAAEVSSSGELKRSLKSIGSGLDNARYPTDNPELAWDSESDMADQGIGDIPDLQSGAIVDHNIDADSLEGLEPDPDKRAVDEDSAKSPDAINALGRESVAGSVEDIFALCDGSVYLAEWTAEFDRKWLAENKDRFKKRSVLNRALHEARSKEFLRLLFPAFESLDFDYPVVFTDDVIKWMQYFQFRGRKAFVTWLRRAEDVIPEIVPVLESYGLPKDLVYLAMIESGFNNKALSIAKAAGTWQFMRATGKLYGLRIDDYLDERRNPARATVAAAQYLTYLYGMFGDWHLAAAAYNAGEGRVKRALQRAEGDDFQSLVEANLLPVETQNYVPKLIAAMIISKNPQKFGFDVTEGSRAMRTKKLLVDRSISLRDLAAATRVDVAILEQLNPELRHGITPPRGRSGSDSGYELRVPEQTYQLAMQALPKLPAASRVKYIAAKVKRSESVASFARRNGVTLASLKSANPHLLKALNVQKGTTVNLPVVLGTGKFDKLTASSSQRVRSSQKSLYRKVKYANKKSRKKTRSIYD